MNLIYRCRRRNDHRRKIWRYTWMSGQYTVIGSGRSRPMHDVVKARRRWARPPLWRPRKLTMGMRGTCAWLARSGHTTDTQSRRTGVYYHRIRDGNCRRHRRFEVLHLFFVRKQIRIVCFHSPFVHLLKLRLEYWRWNSVCKEKCSRFVVFRLKIIRWWVGASLRGNEGRVLNEVEKNQYTAAIIHNCCVRMGSVILTHPKRAWIRRLVSWKKIHNFEFTGVAGGFLMNRFHWELR